MKAIEFYEITEDKLNLLAKSKGISDIKKYYELTEFADGSFLNDFSGKSQIFAQVAFHAQDATMMSSIVKFEKNIGYLKNVCCDFEPNEFLKNYPIDKYDDSVLRLVENFRYDKSKGAGLVWNSSKSKPEKKDALMKRYAKSLIEAAYYINQFENRENFLADLLENYPDKNYKALIAYFRKHITTGFSVALTCDFLKEFDHAFCDIAKPDIHIKDTLCALYDRKAKYYQTEKKEYECIGDMQKLTAEINENLKPDQQITVYQLDRMIWLICSGNFYLDNAGIDKDDYLKEIRKIHN